MVKTHYLPIYKPDAHNPQIIGYSVWAWIGHPLCGEIIGTHTVVETKKQAQKLGRKMRLYFNGEKKN